MTLRRRPSMTTPTRTGSISRRRPTTSSASSLASSSSSTAALAAVLERWPAGIDVVPASRREELGDLLLQVALHAELAREEGTFDASEVARRLNEKLIRRHPHVFAGTEVSSGDLLAQWERIKREEQGDDPKSLLGGVP